MVQPSDNDLRRLEREVVSTHSPLAQGALLRALVQVGRLEAERVQLAAYCGHRGAQAAYPCEVPPPFEFREWLDGLRRFGHRLSYRVALGLVEAEIAKQSSALRDRDALDCVLRAVDAMRGMSEPRAGQSPHAEAIAAEIEALHDNAHYHWREQGLEWLVNSVMCLLHASMTDPPESDHFILTAVLGVTPPDEEEATMSAIARIALAAVAALW